MINIGVGDFLVIDLSKAIYIWLFPYHCSWWSWWSSYRIIHPQRLIIFYPNKTKKVQTQTNKILRWTRTLQCKNNTIVLSTFGLEKKEKCLEVLLVCRCPINITLNQWLNCIHIPLRRLTICMIPLYKRLIIVKVNISRITL